MSTWRTFTYAMIGAAALLGVILLAQPAKSDEKLQANEPQGVVVNNVCELPVVEGTAGMVGAGFDFDHSWGKDKIIELMKGLLETDQIDQSTYDSYMIVDEIQFWSNDTTPGLFRVLVISEGCIEVFFDISEPVQDQLELEFIYGIKGQEV